VLARLESTRIELVTSSMLKMRAANCANSPPRTTSRVFEQKNGEYKNRTRDLIYAKDARCQLRQLPSLLLFGIVVVLTSACLDVAYQWYNCWNERQLWPFGWQALSTLVTCLFLGSGYCKPASFQAKVPIASCGQAPMCAPQFCWRPLPQNAQSRILHYFSEAASF
jgi:hypothetical protein